MTAATELDLKILQKIVQLHGITARSIPKSVLAQVIATEYVRLAKAQR